MNNVNFTLMFRSNSANNEKLFEEIKNFLPVEMHLDAYKQIAVTPSAYASKPEILICITSNYESYLNHIKAIKEESPLHHYENGNSNKETINKNHIYVYSYDIDKKTYIYVSILLESADIKEVLF